jgi:GNAT superfamily N-acetyltransferase
MAIQILRTELNEILSLRALFLQENNIQIRYNAVHERGWSDSYVFVSGQNKIGYAAVMGNENRNDRDTVFEFYTLPSFRNASSAAFAELLQLSGATFIECQSNDLFLISMLYQFGKNINSQVVLFEEAFTSNLIQDGVIFRQRTAEDQIFDHTGEPAGDFVLELGKEIVATGGFLLHYNFPFADLYMEVNELYRQRGLGSYLVQETKKQCYLAGRVPAARCNMSNPASKATLLKAGFKIAGFMLFATIK